MMKQIEAGAWKIVAGALIFSFGFAMLKSCTDRMPPTGPDTAHAQFAPAATAAARPHAASTAVSARLSSASPAAIAPSKLVVTWPALIPPAGLVSGHVDYAIAASPLKTYGEWGPEVGLGGARVDASTTSFVVLPVASLANDVPTSGRVRETWTWWFNVSDEGAQTLVVREGATSGNSAIAALIIDTDLTPVVSVDCCAPAITGASPQQVGVGRIDLAAGWHRMTLTVMHVPSVGPVSVDVFRRGPNDSAPTTIAPFSPATGAPTPPLASASVPAAAASAPRAFPVGGVGHPAPTTTEKKA